LACLRSGSAPLAEGQTTGAFAPKFRRDEAPKRACLLCVVHSVQDGVITATVLRMPHFSTSAIQGPEKIEGGVWSKGCA
jgi:hypothetical protein